MLTADLASLRDLGVGVEPFAVSTRLHSAAIASDDSELAIASGVPALVTRLHDLAGRKTGSIGARERRFRDAARGGAGRPAAVERAAGLAEDKPRKPGRRPSPPGPILAAGSRRRVRRGVSDVDFDLRVRMRAVAAEAERAIDDGHVDRAWADFDSRLRDRLVYEARQTCTLLTARVEAVAATLRAHLDSATPNPVVLPLPTRDHLFEHVQPHRPTAGGRPLATRGQALLDSAYGGILMAFVIPRLAGLKVPIWVLAAGASITAIALVVATVLGERKRRLDRLRSQARRTVRHCTDGFLLSAGKHHPRRTPLRPAATARRLRRAGGTTPAGTAPAEGGRTDPTAAVAAARSEHDPNRGMDMNLSLESRARGAVAWSLTVASVLALSACATAEPSSPGSPSATAPIIAPRAALDGKSADTSVIPDVAERLQPSVVKVITDSGNGSGVVYTSDGLILTNAHVVSETETLQVAFADGQRVKGRSRRWTRSPTWRSSRPTGADSHRPGSSPSCRWWAACPS